MYKQILLPTDGSGGADAATEPALELAETCDAELHVLHVIDLSEIHRVSHDSGDFSERREEVNQALETILEDAADNGVQGEKFIVEQFNADEAIVNHVKEHDMDLVVMGTHGHSGLDRFWLGSTTERVLRRSPVPVYAIPIPSESERNEPLFYGTE